MPDESEVRGLLALMLLSHSRRDARVDEHGDMVLLEDQDRSLWRRDELEQGLALAAQAGDQGSTGSRRRSRPSTPARGRRTTPTGRASPVSTSAWRRSSRSAVVELNRAVAVAMAEGPQSGLRLLDELDAGGELHDYHLLHSARAGLLGRLGRDAEAAAAYARALELATNPVERRFLERAPSGAREPSGGPALSGCPPRRGRAAGPARADGVRSPARAAACAPSAS